MVAVAEAASDELRRDRVFMLGVLAKFTEKQWMIAVRGGYSTQHALRPAARVRNERWRAIPAELAGDHDLHLGMVAFGPTAACVAGMYAPAILGRLVSPLYSDRGFMLSLVTFNSGVAVSAGRGSECDPRVLVGSRVHASSR